ncbi:hypothetical protein Q499_0353 [Chlamydia suis MD56]|uniref:DUF687 family protein n=1 Tax=Chlamydia suis TaxID=83559 RepID=UPI0003BFF782|nr:DUF687 family protein [Chlamydia suis]ESN89496.1 hypothetical protein Q499_0353 [Chlamydia suis MD56]
MSSPCSNDNRNLCCSLTIEEESETESGSFTSSTESLSTTSPAQATAEQVDNLIGGGGQSSSLESLSIASSSDDDRVCGVRVCDFSDEDDEDLQSAVEVAYVNSSGLTNRSVWGDSIRLSEILCRPVTAIPNSGGRACWLLSRGLGLSQCSSIPESHPTVRALLRAWSRFFQRSGSGSFLQLYNGDGGLFVERALQLLSCQDWIARIRVVGLDPSFFVTSAPNRHFYLSPCSYQRLLDLCGFLDAKRAGCISKIPFSPYTQDIVPEVWDSCFEVALRMELLCLTGLTSLSTESSPVSDSSDSSRLQLVRVVSSEESCAFARLQSVLSQEMTSSVRSGNPFPIPYVRLILLLTTLFRHSITSVKAAVAYTPSVLNMLDAGYTASYVAGVSAEIFLLCTNSPDRAQRLRWLRMMARLFASWGWLMGVVELSGDYGVTLNLVIQNAPGTSCVRNMLLWKEFTLTPVLLLDCAARYFPSLWDRAVGLGMRLTTPVLYREERDRLSRSGGQDRTLVRARRNDRYDSRQHAAVGTSVELISVVCGALVQLMFIGVDGFSLRLPEECRTVSCNNTTASQNMSSVVSVANTTAGCSGNSTVRDIFPSGNNTAPDSVARVLNTVRMIWCGVMLLYFLYTAFRLTRNARRGN